MNRYSTYCTPEQTKKAHALGAPIMTFGYGDLGDDKDEILSFNKQVELSTDKDGGIVVGQIPTTEQMVGWLRDKGFSFNIAEHDNSLFCSISKGYYYRYCDNQQDYLQATLTAIDVALDYLEEGGNK